jgi:glutathionyl-hydroquinone reductase
MFSENNSEFFALNTDEDKVPFFSKQNSESIMGMNDLHAPGSYQEDLQLNYLPATNLQNSNYEELVDTFLKNKSYVEENNFLPQGADTNIDYIISNTQNEIKNMLNENKFEDIIKYLNSNFPNVRKF